MATISKTKKHEAARPVIDDESARRFYRDGAWSLRKPKPSGVKPDFNSVDFRGVLAAINVFKTFSYEHDEEQHRLPANPEAVKTHMALGLTAIREQGIRPLDKAFVTGYQRMAALVARPDEAIDEFIATARKEPSA